MYIKKVFSRITDTKAILFKDDLYQKVKDVLSNKT
jgi:hypothetical protein